jgi:hypothetical protein
MLLCCFIFLCLVDLIFIHYVLWLKKATFTLEQAVKAQKDSIPDRPGRSESVYADRERYSVLEHVGGAQILATYGIARSGDVS